MRDWFWWTRRGAGAGGGGGGNTVLAPTEVTAPRKRLMFSPGICSCNVAIDDEDWETVEGEWTKGSGEVSTDTEDSCVQLNVAPAGPYKFTIGLGLPWDDAYFCTTAAAKVTFNHKIVDGYVDEQNYWYVTLWAYTTIDPLVTPRYYYLVCDVGQVVNGTDTRIERVTSCRILPYSFPGITSIIHGATICVSDDHLIVLFDGYTIGSLDFTRESGVIRLKAIKTPHWTLPDFAGTATFGDYALSHVYEANDCDCGDGCPDCTPPCSCDGGWGPTSFEVTIDGFADSEGDLFSPATEGCTNLNGTYECTISSWVSGHNGLLCGIYRTCTWRYGSTVAVHVGLFHSHEEFDWHDNVNWYALHPEFIHNGVTVQVTMASGKYAYFSDEEYSPPTACDDIDLQLSAASVLDEDLYCDTTNASASLVAVP